MATTDKLLFAVGSLLILLAFYAILPPTGPPTNTLAGPVDSGNLTALYNSTAPTAHTLSIDVPGIGTIDVLDIPILGTLINILGAVFNFFGTIVSFISDPSATIAVAGLPTVFESLIVLLLLVIGGFGLIEVLRG